MLAPASIARGEERVSREDFITPESSPARIAQAVYAALFDAIAADLIVGQEWDS